MTKIYTKTGDKGTTSLVGGTRIKKYDLRLECYGTIDELNANIGVIRAYEIPGDIQEFLKKIQNKLFNIGSLLASDEKGEKYTANLAIKTGDIEKLEEVIDEYYRKLPELKSFILPGGNLPAARCHVARTICRRAERRIIELSEHATVQPGLIKYVNRLSDYLFALSRKLNYENGIDENLWEQL